MIAKAPYELELDTVVSAMDLVVLLQNESGKPDMGFSGQATHEHMTKVLSSLLVSRDALGNARYFRNASVTNDLTTRTPSKTSRLCGRW